MMKFEFTKGQIERLLETYNIKDIDNLLNEDVVGSVIGRFFGKNLVAKLESNYGDDAVKVLDNLFIAVESKSGNIIKGVDKKLYLVGANNKRWSMETIKKTIDGVASGKLPRNSLDLLPKTLKDGTNFRSVFQNQFKYGRPKPVTPTPTPNTALDLTYGGAFAKGYKTIQAPMLFTKGFLRKQPFFQTYFRKKYNKLTDDEVKKVWLWFFTGVGDVTTVKQIFIKNGLPKSLVNVGGQLFSKWLFWSIVISLSNLVIDISATLGKKVYPNDIEALKGRWKKNAELANLHWILPLGVIWNQVVAPLLQGGITELLTKNFINRWESAKKQAEVEIQKIESMPENVVKKSKNAITPKPKNTTNQPKVDTTSQNVKTDNESQPTSNQPSKIKIDY
jgi:hypothetical protein